MGEARGDKRLGGARGDRRLGGARGDRRRIVAPKGCEETKQTPSLDGARKGGNRVERRHC